MARVKIEEIVDHLESEFRNALADTMSRVLPQAQLDRHELFREFRRSVGRKCNTWERVPDHYVEAD